MVPPLIPSSSADVRMVGVGDRTTDSHQVNLLLRTSTSTSSADVETEEDVVDKDKAGHASAIHTNHSYSSIPPEESPPQEACLEDVDVDDPSPCNFGTALDYYLSMVIPQKLSGSAAASLNSCSCPLLTADDQDMADLVRPLLKDLAKDGKPRSVAVQTLYRMTDKERKHNRMPMICTTQFNVIGALIPCLSAEAGAADRRRALLLIANLSIPVENKAVLLLNETICDELLPALLRMIHQRWNESYLAAACLFNLSYLDDAKSKLLSYNVATFLERDSATPPPLTYSFHHRPVDHPLSLLRILESLMVEYTQPAFLTCKTTTTSVQREAVRWCMATIKNLITTTTTTIGGIELDDDSTSNCHHDDNDIRDNIIVVGNHTRIPSIAIACLHLSPTSHNVSLWGRDSLEDACLLVLATITNQEECQSTMLQLIDQYTFSWQSGSLSDDDGPSAGGGFLEKLKGQEGIHVVRAYAILEHLEELQQQQRQEGSSNSNNNNRGNHGNDDNY